MTEIKETALNASSHMYTRETEAILALQAIRDIHASDDPYCPHPSHGSMYSCLCPEEVVLCLECGQEYPCRTVQVLNLFIQHVKEEDDEQL